MPYRVEVPALASDAIDRLVALGAIDVDVLPGGTIAALMPDAVSPAQVAGALGVSSVPVSPAAGRDGDSVWALGPRATRVGRLRIVPAGSDPDAAAVRLIDGPAFGTGSTRQRRSVSRPSRMPWRSFTRQLCSTSAPGRACWPLPR